jgi:hypothetical protein
MTERPTSRSARRRSQHQRQKPAPPKKQSRGGLWIGIAGGLVAAGILAFAVLSSGIAGSTGGTGAAGSGGVLAAAQWPPDPPGLRDRLTSHGLDVLTAEGTVLHIHEHLDLFVDGQQQKVPADIGIDQANGILSPVHTHDATGIIHVESPRARDFTLGEFFDVWGVPFTSQCIGTLCTNGSRQLTVFVDGSQVKGDPRAVKLAPHQEIVVAYGTPAQIPDPVPSSFAFAAGL